MTAITKEEIEKLIQKELDNCIKNHGKFHSLHEAYAVTLEEFEECKEDIDGVDDLLSIAWYNIRKNQSVKMIEDDINEYKQYAFNLIIEAIQTYAMIEKTQMLLDDMEERNNDIL